MIHVLARCQDEWHSLSSFSELFGHCLKRMQDARLSHWIWQKSTYCKAQSSIFQGTKQHRCKHDKENSETHPQFWYKTHRSSIPSHTAFLRSASRKERLHIDSAFRNTASQERNILYPFIEPQKGLQNVWYSYITHQKAYDMRRIQYFMRYFALSPSYHAYEHVKKTTGVYVSITHLWKSLPRYLSSRCVDLASDPTRGQLHVIKTSSSKGRFVTHDRSSGQCRMQKSRFSPKIATIHTFVCIRPQTPTNYQKWKGIEAHTTCIAPWKDGTSTTSHHRASIDSHPTHSRTVPASMHLVLDWNIVLLSCSS